VEYYLFVLICFGAFILGLAGVIGYKYINFVKQRNELQYEIIRPNIREVWNEQK
jgi:hypothetical protein